MSKRIIKYVHSDYLIQQADKNPAVKGRASMTHELIRSYGLLKYMETLPAKSCKPAYLRHFHAADFIDELAKYDNSSESEDDDNECSSAAEEYGLGFDCPTWRGIMHYVCVIAGATISACYELCKYKSTDDPPPIVINWTGGWHHAQREKAAGFCYVNDIVLGILALRKRYQRVFYIDLDVHHGDGVQQAFDVTKRVFTLSFHKFECGYYPGSGALDDCGRFSKGYAANFPYHHGLSGKRFCQYFERIVKFITQRYQPDVCVVQCGADVIAGDPLGGTQVLPGDICDCVNRILDLKVPTLLLGGGGYNFSNASRLWTQITATICEQQLNEDIPDEDVHFLQYGPSYSLKVNKPVLLRDENSFEYLENCAKTIEENLTKYKLNAV